MKLDCGSCTQREIGCADCVVTLLMSLPAENPELNADEQAALAVLADSGLVPPLRLVVAPTSRRTG